MKWIVALVLTLLMVTPAMAGQDPYVAFVGQDDLRNPWYISSKHAQFTFNENDFGIYTTPWKPLPGVEGVQYQPPMTCRTDIAATDPNACEKFRSQQPAIQPEVCDLTGPSDAPFIGQEKAPNQTPNMVGNTNSRVTAGNAGWYEWYIRLPKKPTGQINLVLQCGVLKPNAFAIYGSEAIELCAAETGEWIGPNCSHDFVDPGTQPVKVAGLPQIKAIAYPGLYSAGFTAFNLTAFKNPSNYTLTFDASGAITNNGASQVLDGSVSSKVLLKSCFDKAIIVKLPVTGQVNAMGQTESDLVEGDLIYVRMDIPRGGTVDVYCHTQSLKLMGIGEAPF